MSTARGAQPVLGKPLLRGVSHQVFFFCSLVTSAALIWRAAPIPHATGACVVFALTVANLFGTSALYHRVQWSPRARARMRRLDHAAIFLLIAGGYTPVFTLVPSSRGAGGGYSALLVIWLGASMGVLKSLLWPNAPKWIVAVLCVFLGWMGVGQLADRAPVMGAVSIAWLVAGGILFSLGALVYALKCPDPYPRVFGYHEVFHALVVIASVCLYLHVFTVLVASDRPATKSSSLVLPKDINMEKPYVRNRDLLQLKRGTTALEERLCVIQPSRPRMPAASVPESSMLGFLKTFLPMMNEANRKLISGIVEKGREQFDTEVTDEDDDKAHVEMDLASEVADLFTPEALAAAERAAAG